jgi:glutathionylspermidine synthase
MASAVKPVRTGALMPIQALPQLSADEFAIMRRRAMFECLKWDPQVGDESTLADFALKLHAEAWTEIARLSEQLAAETVEMEAELLRKPALHARLGLPKAVRRLLQNGAQISTQHTRVIRFDFHFTTRGWQISEANADVPGGYNESSGFTRLMFEYYSGMCLAGDPALALAQKVRSRSGAGAHVALVHATAFTDDRQVMLFLADALRLQGLQAHLVSPAHLRWIGDEVLATAVGESEPVRIDHIIRFFPAEWLPNLHRDADWQRFYLDPAVPCANPASALLTQSKRLPLVWNDLNASHSTWQQLLPETREPNLQRNANMMEWVLKPALGRVGEDVAMQGVTAEREWQNIVRSVRRNPGEWAMQRRFDVAPVSSPIGPIYPCLGVYTVDGRAAGIYGRISKTPLINAVAKDVAVLIPTGDPAEQPKEHKPFHAECR